MFVVDRLVVCTRWAVDYEWFGSCLAEALRHIDSVVLVDRQRMPMGLRRSERRDEYRLD